MRPTGISGAHNNKNAAMHRGVFDNSSPVYLAALTR
jgi:hypothetical protein